MNLEYYECPKCGQKIILLSREINDEYVYHNYWCNICNIEVNIGISNDDYFNYCENYNGE